MTSWSLIGRQIQQALATSLKRESAAIKPEHHLRNDLGLDSLMVFELLYDLEKNFDLEIPNEDLPGLQTVGDVTAYVEARVHASPPTANAVHSSAPTHKRSAPTKTGSGTQSNPAPQRSRSTKKDPATGSKPTARTTGRATKRTATDKSERKKR